MSPKILLIAIEGAIGVGKSTVVKRLKSFLNGKIGISFVDEPVDEWLQHGFLQGMYDGTITPATFQHMVLQSLAGDLLKTIATEDPVIIISERSAFGNYHVFGKVIDPCPCHSLAHHSDLGILLAGKPHRHRPQDVRIHMEARPKRNAVGPRHPVHLPGVAR